MDLTDGHYSTWLTISLRALLELHTLVVLYVHHLAWRTGAAWLAEGQAGDERIVTRGRTDGSTVDEGGACYGTGVDSWREGEREGGRAGGLSLHF